MIFTSTTLLPSYPTTPLESIDDIIIYLWSKHLNVELSGNPDDIRTIQNLEYTAFVIEFWEEKINEINRYEIQQRRSDSSKNS